MQNRLKLIVAACILAGVMAPHASDALPLIQPGVRAGFYSGEDATDFFIGVDALAAAGPFHVNPNFEWVFADKLDLYTLNLDAYMNVFPFPVVKPWAGAGLGFLYSKPEGLDSGSDVAVNLIAGAGFKIKMDPYVMIKYVVSDFDDIFVFAGGIRF